MTRLSAASSKALTRDLSLPGSDLWQKAGHVKISLTPTPLARQPSAYVQASWADRAHGEIDSVRVQAAYNDEIIAIRLAWNQDHPNRSINDTNVYADVCAILYPENGREADIETMGSPEAPVVGWHWRAGTEQPFQIRATGIGTVERAGEHQVQAQSRWSDGQWQVVLMRGLQGSAPRFDGIVLIGFALWSGAAAERAGLKAYTPEFHDLVLEESP